MRKKPLTNKWHEHKFGHYYVLPMSRMSLCVKKVKNKCFVGTVGFGGDGLSIVYNGKLSHFRTLKSAKEACEKTALDIAQSIIDDINAPERELSL